MALAFHLLQIVGGWVVFETLRFEDEAVRLEEDNGNGPSRVMAPCRKLSDRGCH